MFRSLLIAPLALLSACATIVNGSSQSVTVSTTPPGASCTLDRLGMRVGAITPTPGSIRLDKSKNDLSVTCTKDGYQTATTTHSPRFSGATFGNLLLGGPVGAIVDASSGANYTYPENIDMPLLSTGPKPLPPITLQNRPGTTSATAFRPGETGIPAKDKMARPEI